MKSTTFTKSIEYNLITNAEKWRQGDKINGVLKIKNISLDNIEIPVLKITLAVGNFKKIKSKDIKAWDHFSEILFEDKISISSGEQIEYAWNFKLPEDSQITEKDKSVYLTFFDGVEPWPSALLELVVDPKLVIMQFLEILVVFMRFKALQRKFSKGMVEVKLSPPSSKDMSHVESLVLRMKEVDKTLEIEYIFTTHAFEMVAGNMMAQKKTAQVDQKLTSNEYYIYGDSPNHEFIKSSVSSVIAKATPKFFLPK